MQITAHVTTAAYIKRLVDRLGADSHFLPIRKHGSQMVADLFRTPFHAQRGLHQGGQFRVVEFAGLGTASVKLGLLLRRIRGIPRPCSRASLPAPVTCKSAIRSRSSKDKYRPDRSASGRGIRPLVA